jgi:hypothetical protein
MFERAAGLEVECIWVDALNARPRVWPSVAELLRRHFPGLGEAYRRLLFDPKAREAYLAELRSRVGAAARQVRIADRVRVCL